MATTKRYDVKDLALAADGLSRIEWADWQMPVLAAIRERFEREQPLAGYRIPPGRLEQFREFRISVLKHAFYAEAERTRRPVYTSDAMHDTRIPSVIRERGPHRSQLFVPVVIKDRMIAGFAAVWWEQAREFTEGELALMEALANQVGVALENARLYSRPDTPASPGLTKNKEMPCASSTPRTASNTWPA